MTSRLGNRKRKRKEDDVEWVLVKFTDDGIINGPIKLNSLVNESTGKDGFDENMQEGDICLAPYAGRLYPAKLILRTDDKTLALKSKGQLTQQVTSTPITDQRVNKRKVVEKATSNHLKKKETKNEKKKQEVAKKATEIMESNELFKNFVSIKQTEQPVPPASTTTSSLPGVGPCTSSAQPVPPTSTVTSAILPADRPHTSSAQPVPQTSTFTSAILPAGRPHTSSAQPVPPTTTFTSAILPADRPHTSSAQPVSPTSTFTSAILPGDRPYTWPAQPVPPTSTFTSAILPADQPYTLSAQPVPPTSTFTSAILPADRPHTLSAQPVPPTSTFTSAILPAVGLCTPSAQPVPPTSTFTSTFLPAVGLCTPSAQPVPPTSMYSSQQAAAASTYTLSAPYMRLPPAVTPWEASHAEESESITKSESSMSFIRMLNEDLECPSCLSNDQKQYIHNLQKDLAYWKEECQRLNEIVDDLKTKVPEDQNHYSPTRGVIIEKCRYKNIQEGDTVPEGYQYLVEGSNLAVPTMWLCSTTSKFQGKSKGFAIKKLMDGLFEPAEVLNNSAKSLTDTLAGEAVKLYAIKKLQVPYTRVIEHINAKLSTMRRAYKRLNN